jgi:hypothetical protein
LHFRSVANSALQEHWIRRRFFLALDVLITFVNLNDTYYQIIINFFYRRLTLSKATWHGVVLAQSNETIEIEGNQYFPPDSVNRQYLMEG